MKDTSALGDMSVIAYRGFLALGFLFALWAATFHLTETPPIWYDEGIFSQVAANIALHGMTVLQTAPDTFAGAWAVNGGLTFLGPIALAYRLFGISVLSGRAVMVGFLLLFVALSTALIYYQYGKRASLYSLILVTTFPILYGDGKNVLGEVPGLMYLVGTLLSLLYIERHEFRVSNSAWFVYGLCIGLTVITKPIFMPLLGALFVVALLRWKLLPRTILPWVAIGIGLLLPVGIHLYENLASAPLAEIASYYANPYAISGTSITVTMWDNALRFVTETSPLYCTILFGAWAIALLARSRKKETIAASELAAFIFGILILFFYLRTAGWYRYFFPGEMLALVYFPSSIATLFGTVWFSRRYAALLVCISVIAFGALQTYQLLFHSWVADHTHSTSTADLTKAFASLPATSTVAFIDIPEAVVFAGDHPYSQYIAPTTVLLYGTSILAKSIAGDYDIVVVRYDNTSTLAQLKPHYESRMSAAGYQFLFLKP